MNASVEELAARAIALSAHDRACLVDLLIASLPEERDDEVAVAWQREVVRRVADIESGKASLTPATDVHAEARKLYAR